MKNILLLFMVMIISLGTYAQVSEADKKELGLLINTQKSANSKDILTTLFRAGIDNLLGNKHQFTFSSTFYGLDSIFRGSTSNGSNYEKSRRLKQSSLNIGITGDSVNNITKISGGFTITVINKKDILNSKFTNAEFLSLQQKAFAIADIKRAIMNYISSKHPRKFSDSAINHTLNDSWNKADRNNDFSSLDTLITEALRSKDVENELRLSSNIRSEDIKPAITSILKGNNPFRELLKSISAKYARKPLWTVSPMGIYDRIDKQGQYSLASDFTTGLGKNLSKKPWEIEIKGLFKIQNDTSFKKTNYDSKPLSISIGVNKVLVENEDKESKMEFKFFTQYDHQFGAIPMGTDKNIFTVNTTLRINVFHSLWLPVTIKYDPKNGNFLGFFSITANIGN